MSIELMIKVWKAKAPASVAERMVLLALADMADADGQCWPSYETLAVRLCKSRRYAMQIVQRLIDEGFIEKQRRANRTGQRSNLYKINADKLEWGEQEFTSGVNPASPLGVNYSSPGGEPQFTSGVNYSSPRTQIEPSSEPTVETKKERVGESPPTRRAERARPARPTTPKTKQPPKSATTPEDLPAVIAALHAGTARYPKKNTWPVLIAAADGLDPERITQVAREWVAKGFKDTNFLDILDVARNGWGKRARARAPVPALAALEAQARETNAQLEAAARERAEAEASLTAEERAALERETHAREFWESVLDNLRGQMTRTTFDTWLKRTSARYGDDDALEIIAHNAAARDWLAHRLGAVIARAVNLTAGRDVTVRFVEPPDSPHEVET